jgi:hypothetical protein
MQNLDLPDQVVILSYKEAIAHDQDIVKSASTLRESLLVMYEGEGWRALGNKSWTDYLDDVGYRAGYTSKTLHKFTRAAQLESGAGWKFGTFSEGSIRPISDGLSDRKGFTEEDRVKALDLAITWAGGEGAVTSKHSQMVVAYLTVNRSQYRELARRMHAGKLPAVDALAIKNMLDHTDDASLYTILQEVTDVGLASTLFNMSGNNTDTWKEVREQILATACIPGAKGKQYPLGEASHANLIGYLAEPSYLKRADEMAARRSEMMAVCHAARQVILHVHDNKEPDVTKYPYHNFMYAALKEANML